MVLAVCLYLLVLILLSSGAYFFLENLAYKIIDQRLLAGAAGIKHILKDDFHDRAVAASTISSSEDDKNIELLSSHAEMLDLAFIYTLVVEDNKLYITSSSATDEELDEGVEVRYYSSFDEADPGFIESFGREKPYSFTHVDRWGTFRAVVLPEISPQGRTYLSVAEMEVSGINSYVFTILIVIVGGAILLLGASVPFFTTVILNQKNISRERLEFTRQLSKSQKMESIGRLASSVAHEFNNMLGIIRGFADLALQFPNDMDQVKESLLGIKSTSDRAVDISRQLLLFSRAKTDEAQILDINGTVTGSMKMLQMSVGKSVRLKWMPAEESWSSEINKTDFIQVLVNMCVNARDAMSGSGTIIVESRTVLVTEIPPGWDNSDPGEFVSVSIHDDGCGMKPEIFEQIFEPFFTTKQQDQGTGLGLSTSYGIIRKNRGFIEVKSTHGVGSCFTIYLPRSV
jgi:signal transduction histidine kinase